MQGEGVSFGTVLGERFVVGRLLGRGGFGAVHAAHDSVLDVPLALKILTRCEPAHVVDLKREFRAASALCHPNVVALHELARDGGRWFLTMELLEGCDLREWVEAGPRSAGADADAVAAETRTGATTRIGDGDGDSTGRPAARDAHPWRDPSTVAALFGQIAKALAFVHDAGAIHCDLKPSNVRVTGGDRPVLVDFGLARLFASRAGEPGRFRGTPLYAAPEQLAGEETGPSVDTYALGTMLFEALAGFLPFVGTMQTLTAAKRTRGAVRLAEARPDIPGELAELVDRLLDPDPASRPTAREVAERLGAQRAAATTSSPRATSPALIGRDDELARLRQALAKGGGTVSVVRGPSGIGKTSLAEAAAAEAAARGDVILRARCFERERGPFEVLDGVGASLLAHLDQGTIASDDALTSRLGEVAPLVPCVAARASRSDGRTGAPEEERDRAADAFVALLLDLARRRRTVLCVDDLQWVDADSAWVLRRLLDAEPVAGLSLLFTHRPLASGRNAGADLLDATAVVVDVGPLDREEAARLLRARLGTRTLRAGPLDASVDAVLDHARGSPLLLCELGDLMAEQGSTLGTSLGDVIATRLRGTNEAARTLLELVSLARRPVEEGVLLRAAMRGERHAVDVTRGLLDLVHAGLVRADGGNHRSTLVAVAHAAIGEAALGAVGPASTRALHVAWAEALERAAPDAEAETIARHWVAAAESARARRFLRRAAESAMHAFAFARARDLYELAIRLAPAGADTAGSLVVPLGDVLAAEGRGREAAAAYARAAAQLGGSAALDLERRGAEQLLKSGHIEEGTSALDRVLARAGMRRSRSRAGALVDLIRSRVRAERVAWPVRPEHRAVDDRAARRADASWSIASGLGFVDPIVAADFSSRHFVEAARSNDPLRRLRALTSHAVASAGVGEPARRRVEAVLLDASAIADRLGTARAQAYLLGARAASSALLGDFLASFDAATASDAIFATEVRDAPWEHVTALHMLMWAALHTGRVDVILERAPGLFAERVAGGDRYGATGLGGHYANLAWLVRSTREARRVLDECEGFWRGEAFNLLRYDIELGRVHACLAEGDADEALRLADAVHGALGRAMFLHVGAMRLDATWMRARAVVAAIAQARGARRAVLRMRALRDIRAVERSPIASAPAIADLVRTCLAAALGDHARAHDAVADVATRLERHRLDLLAGLARRAHARYRGERPASLPHAGLLSRLFIPGLPS